MVLSGNTQNNKQNYQILTETIYNLNETEKKDLKEYEELKKIQKKYFKVITQDYFLNNSHT